jgi:hypothetical protein
MAGTWFVSNTITITFNIGILINITITITITIPTPSLSPSAVWSDGEPLQCRDDQGTSVLLLHCC